MLQGEEVTTAMLNIIIAACAQVGDLTRAFETFEVFPSPPRSCRRPTYLHCASGHGWRVRDLVWHLSTC